MEEQKNNESYNDVMAKINKRLFDNQLLPRWDKLGDRQRASSQQERFDNKNLFNCQLPMGWDKLHARTEAPVLQEGFDYIIYERTSDFSASGYGTSEKEAGWWIDY